MIRWHYSATSGAYMFEAYNAQAKTVADLLSETHQGRVVVPAFQRGYSWGKKHVEAFWNDIHNFRKETQKKGGPDKYFLGPIVLMPHPSDKQVLFLLDGQQRLATATILFSVLRDLAHELNVQDAEVFAQKLQSGLIQKEDYGYSLELGELDQAYFQETIQQYPPNSAKKDLLWSHRNIRKARDILLASVKTQIATMAPADALVVLKELRRALRNDLIMASISVTEERDAFRIFETLNDRGLRLSVPDLLLNYLMGRADAPETRKQIRGQWDDMVEGMGKRDINRFVRHMWLSKYGDLKSIDLFTALKTHIESDGKNPLEFAVSCANECDSYVELWNADDSYLKKAAPYVKTLVRELQIEACLPILLSVRSVLPLEELETIAKWLLVFVVRYSIVVGLDSSGMETIFYALARDIRGNIQAGGKEKQVSTVRTLIKKQLVKNAPSDSQIKASVKKLILEPEEAKYLLLRLATHMQTKTKETKIDEANLEHIFPKKPSAEWHHPEDMEPYLWHLGNLTMLGERLNTAAGSKGYTTKREHYQKTSELVMAQDIGKKYVKWGKDAIEKRAESLGPLITEVWDFDNPSRV
jgi:hypothetical protein